MGIWFSLKRNHLPLKALFAAKRKFMLRESLCQGLTVSIKQIHYEKVDNSLGDWNIGRKCLAIK